tara:strand:+ start:210 stop:1028 length:819 start_codon:yes stop_codon:yes gene_type:complete
MEIYTIDEIVKERLETICNIKQPLKFHYKQNKLNQLNLEHFEKNTNNESELNIRDISNINESYLLPFNLKDAIKVLKNDDEQNCYITEYNSDFLKSNNFTLYYDELSEFLKPPMTVTTTYDYLSGVKNSYTPLRYNLHYRNFFYVSNGEIVVKLIPPKDAKFLKINKDYDLFEFNSFINPWDVSNENMEHFKNVNHMDIVLKQGDILYIPAYWCYSIKYKEQSSVCSFQYKTFMNTLAILPEIVMYFLQSQNTKHKTEKTIDDILITNKKSS